MAVEQDAVTGWATPREAAAIHRTGVRAERAEQRVAVLAGREATFAARVLPLEQSRNQYRADYLTLSRQIRGYQIMTGVALALVFGLLPLAAYGAWVLLGWRGPALVVGIVVAAVAWALTRYWEGA